MLEIEFFNNVMVVIFFLFSANFFCLTRKASLFCVATVGPQLNCSSDIQFSTEAAGLDSMSSLLEMY
jgi:hypothetical protein